MKALLLILLFLTPCQALDLSIPSHVTGSGSITCSYEDACQLIASDYGGNVDSWCFVLATHGYDADPRTGLRRINERVWKIGENGSLVVA